MYYMCVYLHVLYVHLYLRGDERKGIHDRESYWTQENAHTNAVNSKIRLPGLQVSARSREPQPLCEVRPPKRPNALLRPPGRRPYLPYLSLPLGHPKPIPAKKEVSGPKGAAETRSGRAPDTCEARHLRRAKRGPLGLPGAHPLGAGRCVAAGTSVPARPASYRRARRLLISVAPAPPAASRCRRRRRHCRRRWRPGHDELRTPPPCPPRRELHCGGEGMGWGRRREGERKRRTR